MSDNIVDLASVRAAKEAAEAAEVHYQFAIRDDLAEDNAPIGFKNGMVTVLLNPIENLGIAFSPHAARQIAVTLIEAAFLAEQDGIIEDSSEPEPDATP